MTARRDQAVVVGLGQAEAGDDAVGLLVARAISAQGGAAVESTDATILLDLLAGRRHVVIVDAVVGVGRAGDILRLWPDELAGDHPAVSCHGIGLASALALADVLLGADVLGAVDIVGVVVDGTEGWFEPLRRGRCLRRPRCRAGPSTCARAHLNVLVVVCSPPRVAAAASAGVLAHFDFFDPELVPVGLDDVERCSLERRSARADLETKPQRMGGRARSPTDLKTYHVDA